MQYGVYIVSDVVLNNNPAEVFFSDSGYPLPIEKRPLWRLCLMCLCIKHLGRADTGLNITKLKIATWMLIRPQRWDEYIECAYHGSRSNHMIGSDYDTDKAIELGLRKGLFEFNGKHNISLLPGGDDVLELCNDIDAFKAEIEFIKTIKSKLTDAFINKIMG